MKNFNLKHIAKLSRLHFSDDELKLFEAQVGDILAFVEKLKEVNVENTQPTLHPLALSNVFREDSILPSLSIEEFLKQAPRARGRFFEVPKVIEDNL